MNEVLVPVLCCLVGFCAYAAVHHALIGTETHARRTHLLFAAVAIGVAFYLAFEVAAYRAGSAEMLVAMRRWEIASAFLIFGVLPWFIASYTDFRPRRLLVAFSVFFAVLAAANFALPYGTSYPDLPPLDYQTLPWGERLVDLQVSQRGLWHNTMWAGIVVVFAYGFVACVHQYRAHLRARAIAFGLGWGAFFALAMENVLVNMGLVHFVRLAEFGFAVLVGVMTFELLRQLRETQRTTQAILDNVPAWIYVKDLHGRYLLSNRRYEDAVHATPGSMLGKTDYEFFPEPEADAKRTADQEVLARRQAPEFEEISTPNGSYLSWRYPLIDFAGVPYAICGIATDISALRQAQHETEALRQQVWHDDRVERAGVLLASLAHELAQPLTAILHNGQAGRRFLAQPDPDLKMIRAILTDIVRDAGRTSSLIGRLRAMLRRQQDQPRERVDLSDCVAEVIELVRNDLRLRHVQVSLAAPEPHVVVASKTQIQQVLLNLLLNGAEAMANLSPDQRRLSISLSSDGTRETVAVRDCGSGFPREDLDKVFDNFYTTKSQGLGMGLAVCRSIIESHSGKIWAEFNENAGTTFFFSLPT